MYSFTKVKCCFGFKPKIDGKKIALVDSIRNMDLTHEEIQKLEEAERNSNALVRTEKIAFNAMKGLFDNGSGIFATHAEPDVELARRILYDEKYQNDKSSIMNPIALFESQ